MKVCIVTGEMSGDTHGAYLAKALYGECPDIQIFGMGGMRMQEAGVTIFSNIMHLNAFQYRYLPRLFLRRQINKNIHIFNDFLRKEKCNAVVIVGLADNTQFISMKIAENTRSLGIPVLYYFAPHVWIWSYRKTVKVARLFDIIFTLFPVEDRAYKEAGAKTMYIGHPLIDEVKSGLKRDQQSQVLKNTRTDDKKLVLFFPGSRKGEIKYHLPVIRKIIDNLSLHGSYYYIVSAANEDFEAGITRYFHNNKIIRVAKGNVYELIDRADIIITSSGTITLEIALMEKPCIVIYKLPWLTYRIGKMFMKVKYISMPNIIMDKKIVPEFLQGKINIEKIVRTALDLLNDEKSSQQMTLKLKGLKKFLGGPGAVQKAAREIVTQYREC